MLYTDTYKLQHVVYILHTGTVSVQMCALDGTMALIIQFNANR